MHSWDSKDAAWSAMHDGAGGRVWRPRPTAAEAIEKCLRWTGMLMIPAMEVRDAAGVVVWRGNDYTVDGALVYAAAGPAVNHPDEEAAVARVCAWLEEESVVWRRERAHHEALWAAAALDPDGIYDVTVPPKPEPELVQEALF